MRNYRLEARLSSRETDNRNAGDMAGWKATVKLPCPCPKCREARDRAR